MVCNNNLAVSLMFEECLFPSRKCIKNMLIAMVCNNNSAISDV